MQRMTRGGADKVSPPTAVRRPATVDGGFRRLDVRLDRSGCVAECMDEN